MKRHSLLAALAVTLTAALLSACAHHHDRGGRYPGPDSTKPEVRVEVNDKGVVSVSVSPRTLVFMPDQKNVPIIWTIQNKIADPKVDPFTFTPNQGIHIRGEVKLKVVPVTPGSKARDDSAKNVEDATFLDPEQNEIIECKVLDGGRQFSCLNKNTRPGRYKYAIQITNKTSSYLVDPPLENW